MSDILKKVFDQMFNNYLNDVKNIIQYEYSGEGGRGSGNFGHSGRPGYVGGSSGKGGIGKGSIVHSMIKGQIKSNSDTTKAKELANLKTNKIVIGMNKTKVMTKAELAKDGVSLIGTMNDANIYNASSTLSYMKQEYEGLYETVNGLTVRETKQTSSAGSYVNDTIKLGTVRDNNRLSSMLATRACKMFSVNILP